ncbi:T6SS immunity protein Tdi1 domain-containing protein [Ralstonia pseudosolanacearum]
MLKDSDFALHVLRPSHQAAIAQRLGFLGQNEVYIPKPYPFLGGTDEPESYEKGDFWVFVELVGICHGFDY